MDEAKLGGGIFVVSLIVLSVVGLYLFNLIDRVRQERASDQFQKDHAPGAPTKFTGQA